ncbi:serine/threonine-protein kinase [Polyangium jinanense]|uniref:Protein kinase n=1 Tax=Polyangium jinanense TaxID=2829994 RepID=A0A9X3XGH7_9BACT|nr:serine/threonine-protein kinase [Polyangium jinanense]MDC3961528.1 protein kinase [Polyangium jinanense]MDC3989025.1 protein kinase [Polyangium jinanense]
MSGSDAESLPSPGAVIADKYTVVRALGRGGMGIVLEAEHQRLGQRVALKLLLPEIRSMGEITARFEREARAVARLSGPHVARILDVDALPDGSPFMVMELLRGRELGDELDERTKIPYREAVGYILQACAAMAEAHRMGIVHRDLKPANLFLCETGGHRTIKVLDFGISKLTGDVNASMTTTASAFGTPLYMSPEQVRSVKNVDARADIWSLGVVLYELLSGELPFHHESATGILAAILTEKPIPIGKRCPEIPRPLADAVMRALEKNPEDRFTDVREFAASIAPYGPPREDPTLAAVAIELEGVGKPRSRGKRRNLFLGAAAVVVAGVTAAIVVLQSTGGPNAPSAVVPVAEPAAPAIPSGVPQVSPVGTALPPTKDAPPAATTTVAPSATVAPPPLRKPTAEPKTSAPPPVKTAPPATTVPDPKYL